MKVRSQIMVALEPSAGFGDRCDPSVLQVILDRLRRALCEEGLVAGPCAHASDLSGPLIVSTLASAHPICELRFRGSGRRVQIEASAAVAAASKQAKRILARRRQITELTDMLADHLSKMSGIADISVVGVTVSEERSVRRL